MSRGVRVVLIILAVALFMCCVTGLGLTLLGTRLIGRAFITNPERVHSIGGQIADYTVPAGYEEMFAMNMMGVKMVALGSGSSTSEFMMIMLMQFPGGMQISRQEMERQIEQALARQMGLGSADMEVVGHEETTIRGESVTLTVREGNTDYGERLRQITGVFPGKSGPTILMIAGEVSAWDEQVVERFIASIE
jgi:hypothetical protein